MAGLFPGICNTQNVDVNGHPLADAVLTVYAGGTLNLASCFQDIGLAIGSPNPMTADLTGRLPIFFVNDGTYRVRLVDQNGVLVFDYPQVPSIGASSSGGGGSAVDPTTIAQTGDEIFRKIGGTRTGWVRQNGLTIGSATSGASERGNADCQNLFLFLWNNYPQTKCIVTGGRGASAAADWAANKQISLPDMRGIGPFGKDGMGNIRANRIPDSNVSSGGGDTADTDAASGGVANQGLTQANLPALNLPVSGLAANLNNANAFAYGAGSGGQATLVGQHQTVPSDNQTIPTAQLPGITFTGSPVAATGGSGTAVPVMNPFALGTWYLKLAWIGLSPMIGEVAMKLVTHFAGSVYCFV